MKVSEFEAKLADVGDNKLRQMLMASRRDGPEIAVALLLAECRRRGMDGLDERESAPSAEAGPESFPAVASGHGFARESPLPDSGDEIMDAPPATAPEWLNEESKTGLSAPVKVLLFLAVIGGLAGAAWMFTR